MVNVTIYIVYMDLMGYGIVLPTLYAYTCHHSDVNPVRSVPHPRLTSPRGHVSIGLAFGSRTNPRSCCFQHRLGLKSGCQIPTFFNLFVVEFSISSFLWDDRKGMKRVSSNPKLSFLLIYFP